MALGKKKKSDGDEPADGAAPAPAGKSSNLIPAVVVALGLIAGGFMMSRGGSTSHAAEAASTMEATTTTVAHGEIVKLEALTVNLADGRYLKIGLALQLSKKAKPEGFTKGGEGAKALDLAVRTFGRRTYAELQAPKARDDARDALSEQIAQAYDGDVLEVYVTEFVMQ